MTTVSPAAALLVFAGVVAIVAVVFWPRRGVWARVARLARLSERVQSEDALKHVHDCEYREAVASLESLAGALEVTRDRAARLATRLSAVGLVRLGEQRLTLTPKGRAEALRVLRSHRLWERYLADRTGVDPGEWHDRAEAQEHLLSQGQVEELAASMGHPVYDPHGDPIPTASGVLPPRAGIALTTLRAGRSATVVHLEDEPQEVYERLLAIGLAPGAEIRLDAIDVGVLRLQVDGVEHMLDPVMAANITVAPLGSGREAAGPFTTLAELTLGEAGVVTEIAPSCTGPQRRRLLDLGFVPGTAIRAELQGALSGAVAYRVRDTLIALRADQAEQVRIERVPAGAVVP